MVAFCVLHQASARVRASSIAAALLLSGPALLPLQRAAAAPAPAAPPEAADSIVLYFNNGSAAIRPQDAGELDRAARTFREGKPIIMTVSGSSDATGDAQANLSLSQRRADVVFRGLVARGIPANRFQIIAKGETEPASKDSSGNPDPKDRRAEITWR